MTVSQVLVRPPAIMAYVHLRGADGRFISELGDGRLSATVAGKMVPVTAVRPFPSASTGVAYLFVIDTSKSVDPRQFLSLRDAIRTWVASLMPEDRAAIVGFGQSIDVLADFTGDAEMFLRALDAVQPADDWTRFNEAMLGAFDLLDRHGSALPDRRVIVVISDGQNDVVGGVSEREVLGRLQSAHVPVFGIGLYEPPRTPAKDRGLQALGEIARASGGHFVGADELPGGDILALVTSYARQPLVVELACGDCPRDGNTHRVQLTAAAGARTLTDGIDVRLFAPPVAAPVAPAVVSPWWRAPWVVGAGLSSVVFVAALVALARRRQRTRTVSNDPTAAGPAPVAVSSPVGVDDGPRVATPPPLSIRLTPLGITAAGSARTASLAERVVIGRSAAEADVAFPDDPQISNAHCVLLRRDSRILLRDLGSTNGTSLNGVPIRGEQPVEHDDVIGLGRIELRLSINESLDGRRS